MLACWNQSSMKPMAEGRPAPEVLDPEVPVLVAAAAVVAAGVKISDVLCRVSVALFVALLVALLAALLASSRINTAQKLG